MRERSFIVLAAVVAVLVALPVGVYAYDASRDDMIAEGVTVAGIDLGGLSVAEARTTLRVEIATPVLRPLRVQYGRRQFTLSSQRAQVRADVEGMVAEALARSRDGNMVTRTFRVLTGGEVKADLPARIDYSRKAVDALVRGVKRAVNRPAVDATVEPSASGLTTIASRDGVNLLVRRLWRAVNDDLSRPDGSRVVKAHSVPIKPKVTLQNLAQRYPYYLTVDRDGKTLRFFRNLKLVREYTIAVGQAGFETPAGLYHIQNKEVNPSWSVPNRAWAGSLAGTVVPGGAANNPLKARWLGIADGAGIHGTAEVSSLGTNASHGCIRMSIPEVIELYDQVPVQTPIYIA